MALRQPRTVFGIHDVTLYEIATGLPYGTLRVLGGSSLALNGEVVPLTGGSSAYPWDAQDGAISAEIALKPKEIPNFLFKVFLGKTPTEVLADAGNVANFANVKNESVLDATTGIATASVKSGSEADLKFGKFIVKAASAITVDIYAASSIDFLTGADLEYLTEDGKITASPLTITAATPVTIPSLGVELTGGSGTIDLTVGDTATFEVNPPSTIQNDVNIGELGACVPEFGAIMTAQKQGDGSMWLLDVYRVKAIGFPIGMEEKAFNEPEITGTCMYDSAKNGVFKARYLKPAAGCV